MGLGGPHFYHKTTRKMIALFGYLFSDIEVNRAQSDGTTKTIKVPCGFGSPHRESYVSDTSYKLEEGVRVGTVLPRMGFTLDGWAFDPERKLNTTEKLLHNTNGYQSYQLQKVPVNMELTLGIKTDHLDDLWQILEQILPWFDPKLIVGVKANTDLDLADDVSIHLNSTDPQIDWEGSLEDDKSIEATLDFTIKTHFYRPTVSGKPILTVDIDLIASMDEGLQLNDYNSEHIQVT